MLEQAIGLVDDATLLKLDELGDDHKPLKPNLQTGKTAFGEFTRLGSQVEMSGTPEYWADPIIQPIGSSEPVWMPRSTTSDGVPAMLVESLKKPFATPILVGSTLAQGAEEKGAQSPLFYYVLPQRELRPFSGHMGDTLAPKAEKEPRST